MSTSAVSVARWVSIVLHPFVTALVLAGALDAERGIAAVARSVTIVGVLFVLPLAALTVRQVRRGAWATVDASEPRERPILFAVGTAGLLALLLYFARARPGTPFVAGMASVVGMVGLCAILTPWLKVSLHVAAAALAASVLLGRGLPIGWLLAAVLPALAWSRVALGRHRWREVFVGLMVGLGTGALVTHLMRTPHAPFDSSRDARSRAVASRGVHQFHCGHGTQHLARIVWSAEQVRRGLPAFTRTTDPAWFAPGEEAWSLVCRFHASPRKQGSPSVATIEFLLADAPHDRLVPGVKLSLFERSTRDTATVEVIEGLRNGSVRMMKLATPLRSASAAAAADASSCAGWSGNLIPSVYNDGSTLAACQDPVNCMCAVPMVLAGLLHATAAIAWVATGLISGYVTLMTDRQVPFALLGVVLSCSALVLLLSRRDSALKHFT